MQVDNVLPQHDLDAQRRQGRAWITEKGRGAIGQRIPKPPLWCRVEPIGRGVWKLTHVASGQSRIIGVDRTAFTSHDEYIDWVNTSLQNQADKLVVLYGRMTRSEKAYRMAKQLHSEGYDLNGPEWIAEAQRRQPEMFVGW